MKDSGKPERRDRGTGGFQAWLDSLAQPELNPQPVAPVQGMYIPETVLEPERVEPVWEGMEPAVSQELPRRKVVCGNPFRLLFSRR